MKLIIHGIIRNKPEIEMVVHSMLSQQDILRTLQEQLKVLREEYAVSRLALFGSYLRDEQHNTSDMDILVEFADGKITFDHYMDVKFHLEDLFNKKIDLVILDDVKPGLKDDILRSAKFIEEV